MCLNSSLSQERAISRLITQQRPGVSLKGIDVLLWPSTYIPVRPFDGVTIPYPGASFDVTMLVGVLHHTADPLVLLREAARAGKMILIKGHFREGFLADATLRLLGLKARGMNASLGLYPVPVSWLFERGLHFVGRLEHVDDVSPNSVHPRLPGE